MSQPIKYHKAVIITHWLMAIWIIGMLVCGYAMTHFKMEKMLRFDLYQYHKSFGIVLLLAFFVRILIRSFTKNPPMPNSMKPLDKKAAKFGHILLYILIFIMPFSGWLMVSSSSNGLPTILFNTINFPDFPYLTGNREINHFANESHEIIAYFFAAIILLHIAAVVKHYFIDGENLLPRMGIGKTKEKINE